MKLTWRNGVAYLLLACAIGQYLLTAPVYLEQLAVMRRPDMIGAEESSLNLIVGWLVGPLPLIGWAAVVEYLSRIASALQRDRGTTT